MTDHYLLPNPSCYGPHCPTFVFYPQLRRPIESKQEINKVFNKFLYESFLEKHKSLKIRSVITSVSTYLFASVGLLTYCRSKSPWLGVAFLVASVAFAVAWYTWGNLAARLGYDLVIAISKGDEAEAIRLIEQGADIFRRCGWQGPSLPGFIFTEFNGYYDQGTVLACAAELQCHAVMEKLLSINQYSDLELYFAFRSVRSKEGADLLIQAGANINMAMGDRSLLGWHRSKVDWLHSKMDSDSQKQFVGFLEEKGAILLESEQPGYSS